MTVLPLSALRGRRDFPHLDLQGEGDAVSVAAPDHTLEALDALASDQVAYLPPGALDAADNLRAALSGASNLDEASLPLLEAIASADDLAGWARALGGQVGDLEAAAAMFPLIVQQADAEHTELWAAIEDLRSRLPLT